MLCAFCHRGGLNLLLLLAKLTSSPLMKEKLKNRGITIFVLLLFFVVGHQIYKTAVNFGGVIGLLYGLSITIIILGWLVLNLSAVEWKKN